ncbi:MAG: hypothetical protein PVSMB8_04560 [Vulcanimicrobiaceae bacterium]
MKDRGRTRLVASRSLRTLLATASLVAVGCAGPSLPRARAPEPSATLAPTSAPQRPSATEAPETTVPAVSRASSPTYRELARAARDTLVTTYYHAAGWRLCPLARCRPVNRDWGADSLTYALAFYWRTTRDATVVPVMRELARTAPRYPKPCSGIAGLGCTWSDAPQWDAIATLRENEVIGGDPATLALAIRAFDTVEGSGVYTGGACRDIRYQQPFGYLDRLKTLETEATAIEAALSLYRVTSTRRYLDIAIARYARARRYFLDPSGALYSVFVFDEAHRCTLVARRFFASVNGWMISSGIDLYRATGNAAYRAQAISTASAVDERLGDARGVFADLQADNDIVEPLVEAMYELATRERAAFARAWVLRNAAAAASARTPDGSYGRFFDGPPPPGGTNAWQTNGGFALVIAAAALDGDATPAPPFWRDARLVKKNLVGPTATLRFTGSAIALVGAIGEPFLQPGHERVFIDGVETENRTGIWQGSSSALRKMPGAVLFAWRWPTSGPHVLRFAPGRFNLKEGGPYLHVTSYLVK